MLSPEAWARGRRYLANHGRPVDQAVLACRMGEDDHTVLLEALAPYQNDDGGFGHALEPDMRMPGSSVIATTVAFQMLRECGVPVDAEAAARGATWLAAQYDPERGRWPIVPPAFADHPRAPWWDHLADAPAEAWANPNAEVVGVLCEHSRRAPAPLLAAVLPLAERRLAELPSPLEPYAALCFLRLAESPGVPRALRDAILAKLRREVPGIEAFDPERWEAGSIQPFWLAGGPHAPLAESLGERLGGSLEREEQRQHADGYWEPRWTWGERFADVWEQARLEWRSEQTLRTLLALRDRDRVAA